MTQNAKGITHIEDLDAVTFIDVIKNLDKFQFTEKVDGSQLLFGIDDKGFYTSRETKGGKRVYNVEDYEINFSNSYRRSAHILLEKHLTELKLAGLKNGDQVEIEVLYGKIPNVVPYYGDYNSIVFLRTVDGSVDISLMFDAVSNLSSEILVDVPITHDGKTIKIIKQSEIWDFAIVPRLEFDTSHIKCVLEQKISEFSKYLCEISSLGITNNEVALTPLNRCPPWCDKDRWGLIKDNLKVSRDFIRKNIESLKLDIKEYLLESIIRKTTSKFGNGKSWIEGVVLHDPISKVRVKLIDKNTFGNVRIFAWKIRNELFNTIKVQSLCNDLDHTELVILLDNKRCELIDRLDKYEKEEDLLEIAITTNEVSYKVYYKNSPIGQRTRETFATLFQQILLLENKLTVYV